MSSPGPSDLVRLPRHPVAYHQLLRGPTWRWWRPLVSLACLVGGLVVVVLVVLGLGAGLDALLPNGLVGRADDEQGPLAMVVLDLLLAGLVPASMAAVALAYRRRAGWLTSVAGRVRWRWLLRCLVVLLPLFAVSIGLELVLDPPTSGRPEHWVQLLVLALLLTPLQAAGEEYLFRGWLVQNVGACFARPALGLVAGVAVSAGLFALAHGSLHPWVLVDLAAFAVACCLVDWRTGGLEAGIAIHAANNVVIFVLTTVFGGFDESFVDSDTTGSPGDLSVTVVVLAVAVALVWWQARRTGVVRLSPALSSAPPVELPDAVWIAPLGR